MAQEDSSTKEVPNRRAIVGKATAPVLPGPIILNGEDIAGPSVRV